MKQYPFSFKLFECHLAILFFTKPSVLFSFNYRSTDSSKLCTSTIIIRDRWEKIIFVQLEKDLCYKLKRKKKIIIKIFSSLWHLFDLALIQMNLKLYTREIRLTCVLCFFREESIRSSRATKSSKIHLNFTGSMFSRTENFYWV